MMRNSLKYPLFVIIFLFSFILFLPKENIYFYYLEKLQHKHITVQNEETTSGVFDFSITNGDVFYKDINAFKIENINIQYILVYGKIVASNILFDGLKVDTMEFNWSILKPFYFDIVLLSNDLNGYGTYDIKERNFELYLKPSPVLIKKYELFFNQGELMKSGEYKIEYNL
jgi:hypothetical protein